MSNDNGDLVIKPCTRTEVEFYERATAEFPSLALCMPVFMGTLRLNERSFTNEVSENGIYGRGIDTDECIVLGNLTADFRRPCVLDVKLGARLWDDDASNDKRVKLDRVSGETTSGCLGFRLTGMRVWNGVDVSVVNTKQSSLHGDELFQMTKCVEVEHDPAGGLGGEYIFYDKQSGYRVYSKFYGRHFTRSTVHYGLREFVNVKGKGFTEAYKKRIMESFVRRVRRVRDVIAGHEVRMYSASLLFVYEGDAQVFQGTWNEGYGEEEDDDTDMNTNGEVYGEANGGEYDMEGESTGDSDVKIESRPPFTIVKLIDFAHAHFEPGRGCDENVLKGIDNFIQTFNRVIEDEIKDEK